MEILFQEFLIMLPALAFMLVCHICKIIRPYHTRTVLQAMYIGNVVLPVELLIGFCQRLLLTPVLIHRKQLQQMYILVKITRSIFESLLHMNFLSFQIILAQYLGIGNLCTEFYLFGQKVLECLD